jgi:hypothetical protein
MEGFVAYRRMFNLFSNGAKVGMTCNLLLRWELRYSRTIEIYSPVAYSP